MKKIADLEAQLAEASIFDASKFPNGLKKKVRRTVQNENLANNQPSGFIKDASGRPTDEDIETMLHFASLAVTSGGKSDWFLVL